MAETFRSVFRQRKVEKIYCIDIERKKDYVFSSENYKLFIKDKDLNVLSDDVVGTYDVEIPLLEPGDKFYLNDINEAVVIKERMRSSDGSIVYYCEDKLIETENTKESFEKCQIQKEKFDKLLEENNKLEELKRGFSSYRRRYKYKHRWFNFKTPKEDYLDKKLKENYDEYRSNW